MSSNIPSPQKRPRVGDIWMGEALYGLSVPASDCNVFIIVDVKPSHRAGESLMSILWLDGPLAGTSAWDYMCESDTLVARLDDEPVGAGGRHQ